MHSTTLIALLIVAVACVASFDAAEVHEGACPSLPFPIRCRRLVCTPAITEIKCHGDSACRSNEKCCHIPCSCTTRCVAARAN